MKIVCISDTHMQHNFHVPDGDVLVHAGDATWRGDLKEVREFAHWYGSFPHKHKIFVAGNHDWGFQKNRTLFQALLECNNIIYLEDSGITIDGLNFWGSPWQPEFNHWAFNLSRFTGELAEKWALIPDDTHVLITHGPPRNICDLTLGYECMPPSNVGCHDLRERVENLKQLKLHAFGHVHGAHGTHRQNGRIFVNASICNEKYHPVNQPIVILLHTWESTHDMA